MGEFLRFSRTLPTLGALLFACACATNLRPAPPAPTTAATAPALDPVEQDAAARVASLDGAQTTATTTTTGALDAHTSGVQSATTAATVEGPASPRGNLASQIAKPLRRRPADSRTTGRPPMSATGTSAVDAPALGSDAELSAPGDAVLDSLRVVSSTVPGAPRYTADIDDATLARLWNEDRARLGSVCLGVPYAGRLVNGVQFPEAEGWKVIDPPNTFATEETVAGLRAALEVVRGRYPDAAPVRVNHISAEEGGFLPPHSSHQIGRDVDIGFFRIPDRGRAIDIERTWYLLRALITTADVERVLVDRRVQRRLLVYARAIGEDEAWLTSVFEGRNRLVMHARGHRDHFHVRYYNPRAQELGRRLRPLLGDKEDPPQLIRHRIRNGHSLGWIAIKYGVSIRALQRANRMGRSTFLRAGETLVVPVRGSCKICPVPPKVRVPPRRLPPDLRTPAPRPGDQSPRAALKCDRERNPNCEPTTPSARAGAGPSNSLSAP